MENHNIFARKQLLSLASDIFEKVENVKRCKEDDEFDEEFKDGARKTYAEMIRMIYQRVEDLENEQK